MEPFAYQKPQSPDHRKLGLVVLAAASFGIWYFDLMPELSTVPKGTLSVDVSDPGLRKDDFLALLESGGIEDSSQDSGSNDEDSGPDETDPLMREMTGGTSLADAFPEFGEHSEPPIVSDSIDSSIQQVDFENEPPADVQLSRKPDVIPAAVADLLTSVDTLIEAGETLEAHAALSRLYWKTPELRSYLYSRIQRTAAEIYANPSAHFAQPHMVEHGETLQAIAMQYNVPWRYLAQLNQVQPQSLQAGTQLKVLKGPFSAAIDLRRFELTVHAHGWYVHHYTIGLGQDGGTPLGRFTVGDKQTNPTWQSPDGTTVAAGDPSNPLGGYWIGLGNQIGIHGTADPAIIGTKTLRGSVHMRDTDIAEVFHLLDKGCTVEIIDR